MKHKLAVLLLLLSAGVARADTIYEIHATSAPNWAFPQAYPVTGSYETSHGQITGLWSFQFYDAGASGIGAGGPNGNLIA